MKPGAGPRERPGPAVLPWTGRWRSRPALVVWLAGKALAAGLWPLSRGGAAVVFFSVDLVLLYHLFVPTAQGLGRTFTRFVTTQREVWLTIDDGPDPLDTPRILELLDRHHACATFFLVGERAAREPQLAREILSRGHEVAHHTQTHPSATFWCAGPGRVGRELDEALEVLRAAGAAPRWFRPAVGIKSLFLAPLLHARGLANVAWSVRSLDGVASDPAQIYARVLRDVEPGAILLMHEGASVAPAVRVTAIARVLEGLAKQGYRCVLPCPGQLR